MKAITDGLSELKSFGPRKFLIQVISIGVTVGSALMLWNILKVISYVESPIVVVLTASMEPAFYRGDILFVYNRKTEIRPGDIPVFQIKSESIPIVHRLMIKQDIKYDDRKFYLLTKGDNNHIDDRGLYPQGQTWIHRQDVLGFIEAYCPYVGYVTIMMNDYPPLKYAVLLTLALTVLFSNDPDE
jgi:signal peptidase